MSNPIAPIGHHWLDATHITFGVITDRACGDRSRWKVEASAFNGREPDENRTDIDLARARLVRRAVQRGADADDRAAGVSGTIERRRTRGGPAPERRDACHRVGVVPPRAQPSTLWASTIAWGMNHEPIDTTHALLSSRRSRCEDRHVGFLRGEIVGKPAHDLHVHESTEVFTVGKIQLGYTHYLRPSAARRSGSAEASRAASCRAPWRRDTEAGWRQAWRCSSPFVPPRMRCRLLMSSDAGLYSPRHAIDRRPRGAVDAARSRVRAQNTEPRIWQGVYTAAQAERGKTSFNSSCLRCHGDKLQGNTAPALSGDRFFTTWGNEVIASLFAKIRDTMPPNFGTSIDDQTKLDIVAYILQTNGYPAGPAS